MGLAQGPTAPGARGGQSCWCTLQQIPLSLQKGAAATSSAPWLSQQDPSAEACGRLWTLGSTVRIPNSSQCSYSSGNAGSTDMDGAAE